MLADWNDVALEEVADELTVGYVGPMASEYVYRAYALRQAIAPLSAETNVPAR